MSTMAANIPPVAARIGRAPSTTHAEISHTALRLFIDRGFDRVTVDEISVACGIGRRTFFRYYPSKNDLPWGQFDDLLDGLRDDLRTLGDDLPLAEALREAIIAFNQVPDHELAFHRQRMQLLLHVPTLLAHSTLRYEAWRQVIADYVAERMARSALDHVPQTIAWVCLGISLAAYEQWLREENTSLSDLIGEGFVSSHKLFASYTS